MRKTILVLASVALAMLVAGGVAFAATIGPCPGYWIISNGGDLGEWCWGTPEADTINAGPLPNHILALAGNDTVYAGGDDGPQGDYVEGGVGSDRIYGGPGSDALYPGGDRFDRTDSSDDYVHGGRGTDFIRGGYAQGGVDRIYGERANDTIKAAQRQPQPTPVTKEIIDCGAGNNDVVNFDRGVDVVRANCEVKRGY